MDILAAVIAFAVVLVSGIAIDVRIQHNRGYDWEADNIFLCGVAAVLAAIVSGVITNSFF